MAKQAAPPGHWETPISAALVAGKSLRFGALGAHGDNIYWVEGRPDENGRNVLVSWSRADGIVDLTPAPISVRSKVHEYGGGEFLAGTGGVYFIDDDSQDVFQVRSGGAPDRITDKPHMRFSDFCEDTNRDRLIGVGEDHGGAGHPKNMLVTIGVGGVVRGQVGVLHGSRGFYASPVLSPHGDRLAFLAWDLPHMPWEAAELLVCQVNSDGGLSAPVCVAGGVDAAAFQPSWMVDGHLVYVAETGDRAELYVWDGKRSRLPVSGDGDFSRPLWALGTSTFALLDDHRIAASFLLDGEVGVGLVDVSAQTMTLLDLDCADFINPVAGNGFLAAQVTKSTQAPAITLYPVSEGKLAAPQIIARSTQVDFKAGDIAHGVPIVFPGFDGGTVHALLYRPTNSRFELPANMLPPAIVSAHGGPTGFADRGLKLKIQYWTSRGFAYLDVDYRGSAGYGKNYRLALDGNWGVLDAGDVVCGAKWLGDQGIADRDRIVVSGSSAGGYTVLQALVHSDVFAAGAAYYGISDLVKLAAHTHKFEAGYIYRLTGTSVDNAASVFAARSPLNHADKITSPIIFLQGAEDKVVPPEQSIHMAQSLEKNGIPVAYIEYAGEGHGFRKPGNVKHSLEAELKFYNDILGLEIDDALPQIEIKNFPAKRA